MVITAIGQAPDVTFVERDQKRLAELKTTRRSTIEADPRTLQTNIPYLFTAGDSGHGTGPGGIRHRRRQEGRQVDPSICDGAGGEGGTDGNHGEKS